MENFYNYWNEVEAKYKAMRREEDNQDHVQGTTNFPTDGASQSVQLYNPQKTSMNLSGWKSPRGEAHQEGGYTLDKHIEITHNNSDPSVQHLISSNYNQVLPVRNQI